MDTNLEDHNFHRLGNVTVAYFLQPLKTQKQVLAHTNEAMAAGTRCPPQG